MRQRYFHLHMSLNCESGSDAEIALVLRTGTTANIKKADISSI